MQRFSIRFSTPTPVSLYFSLSSAFRMPPFSLIFWTASLHASFTHATSCKRCLNCQSNFRLKVFLLFLTPTAVSLFVYSFFCFCVPVFSLIFWTGSLLCLLYACHLMQRCVPASAFQHLWSSICVSASTFQYLWFSIRVSASTFQHLWFSSRVPAFMFQQSCFSIRVPAVVFQHLCFSLYISVSVIQHSCFNIYVSTSVIQ